ncbi:MAG: helix-turn-helix transcriptional regulator [Lachnospiraceae bacterium]|nr:helix-turn-helix transcriptional regulator [Lachnospiraceae bacterium]
MTLGEKIREARKAAGLTQEELANILSVSRQAITKWESDKGMPDVSNLKVLSQALNVSVDYLLDEGSPLDLSVTQKPIDLRTYGDTGRLSRMKKVKIKERIIRDEYPDAEIIRLTVTKIKNTKRESAADTFIGLFALLLAHIPLFGTQEFGKTIQRLDRQYYLVNESSKQYFVMLTDEFMVSRAMAAPIRDKKFEIADMELLTVGTVDPI